MSPAPDSPRTVLPPRRAARRSDPEVYEAAAQPILRMVEQLATIRGVEAQVLIQRAAEALDRFDADLERAGVTPSTIRPARYALGLALDQAARKNRVEGCATNPTKRSSAGSPYIGRSRFGAVKSSAAALCDRRVRSR